MMLTPSIFEGELSIGQVEQPDVAASVQWFINKYEPLYLAKLLGEALARGLGEQFPTPAPTPAPAQRWLDLAEKVKPMLSGYVYFYYQRNAETQSAGVGEVEAQAENSTRRTVSYKMVRAWNEAAKQAKQFRAWIDTAVYPEYSGAITCDNADIYELKNSFGL
jgi:hypothetical protein